MRNGRQMRRIALASAFAWLPLARATSVDWYTIDAGGGRSAGGAYAVVGTLGQADADPVQPSAGGDFAVLGGFWAAPSPVSTGTGGSIFRDGFE